MARIRTIKPEFFQHEELFDAEKQSGMPLRIAFAGLWTVADKAGRFEWKPRSMKLNVLPYDEVDFSEVLSTLEKYGFVIRYEVDGKQYGCIPTWDKHQHINVREPDSAIPAHAGASCDAAPAEAGVCTDSVPDETAGKGREGKGKGKEREDARGVALLTVGLDTDAFERWLDYRNTTKRKLQPVSFDAAAKALAAFGEHQSAVVEQSIANGWQGLFPLKVNGSNAKPQTRYDRMKEQLRNA